MAHSKVLIKSIKSLPKNKRVLQAMKGLSARTTTISLLGKLDNFVDELKEIDDGTRGDEECILVKQSLRSLEKQVNKEPQNAHYYLQDLLNVVVPQICCIIDMRKQYIDEKSSPKAFEF